MRRVAVVALYLTALVVIALAAVSAPVEVVAVMPVFVAVGYLITRRVAWRALRDRDRWYRAYEQALEEIQVMRSGGDVSALPGNRTKGHRR